MLQQTALMLVAGLIFLFFFTPGREQAHAASPVLTIFLLAAFTLTPGLLSYFFGRRAIKRLTNDRDRQIRQLQNSRRYTLLFGIAVLAGFVFEVYYLRLPVLVNRAFAFLEFENSRTLIGIIPLITAILLTRLAIFELDRQVRNTSWTRKRFLSLNLKLMIFPLLPFIVYLFIGDLIDHSPIFIRIFFISNSYVYWIIMLAIVMIMYIEAPSLLRMIWVTRSLPAGETRNRIELLAEKENIKYRDVLVWSTAGGKIANAGMAGLLPGSRYIFLTDSLLGNFTVDEIETIVAHEFGHIKHRHTLAYLVLSLGYLMFYVFLYVRSLSIIENLHLGTTSIAFLGAVVTLIAFYTYFIFIFRFLSRRFERQADLYAIDSTGKPEIFKSALIRLAAINYTPRRAPLLVEIVRTHPSVSRRLEFVDRVGRGDTDAVKYRRPVFHVGRVSVLVLLALSLLFITSRSALSPPSDVHYEMGWQYYTEGMIDEAIVEFREAARANPQSGRVHYALGILYTEKGAIEEAIGELERALELSPDNAAAREKLSQIQSGGSPDRSSR
jgi:Zn-dependent protease with chaperone function